MARKKWTTADREAARVRAKAYWEARRNGTKLVAKLQKAVDEASEGKERKTQFLTDVEALGGRNLKITFPAKFDLTSLRFNVLTNSLEIEIS